MTVVEAAVGARSGTGFFREANSYSEGRLLEEHEEHPNGYAVRVVALDDFAYRGHHMPPKVLKVDVEGAEHSALEGSRSTLSSARPSILLSTHSTLVRHQCLSLLAELDYDLQPMFGEGTLATDSEVLALPRPGVRRT